MKMLLNANSHLFKVSHLALHRIASYRIVLYASSLRSDVDSCTVFVSESVLSAATFRETFRTLVFVVAIILELYSS